MDYVVNDLVIEEVKEDSQSAASQKERLSAYATVAKKKEDKTDAE